MTYPLALVIAETAASSGGGGDMNYITTGAIAAICSLISGVVLYTKGRQKREITIDGQPVGVRLEKEFVTRTEFAEFRGEIKADVREMRGSYDRLVMLIDERDKKLAEMIERVASGAYEGRRRIHDTLNATTQRVTAIETKADISKGLASLGKAIMARPCLEKPGRNHTTTDGN